MEEVRVLCLDMGTVNFAGSMIRVTKMPPDFDTKIVELYDKLDGAFNPPPADLKLDWLHVEAAFTINTKTSSFSLQKCSDIMKMEKEYSKRYNDAKLDAVGIRRREENGEEIIDCTGADPVEKKPPPKNFIPRVKLIRSTTTGKTDNQKAIDGLTKVLRSEAFLFLSLMEYYVVIENQMDQTKGMFFKKKQNQNNAGGNNNNNGNNTNNGNDNNNNNNNNNKQKRYKNPIMWVLSLALRSTFNPIQSRMKPHVVCFTRKKYGLDECKEKFVPEYFDMTDKDKKYDIRKAWSKKIAFALCWASRQHPKLRDFLNKVDKPDIPDTINMAIHWIRENFKKPTKKQIETGNYNDEEDNVDIEEATEVTLQAKKKINRKRKIDVYLSTNRDKQGEEAPAPEPPKKKQKIEKAAPKDEIDPEEEGKKVYSKKKKPVDTSPKPTPKSKPNPKPKESPKKQPAKKQLAKSAPIFSNTFDTNALAMGKIDTQGKAKRFKKNATTHERNYDKSSGLDLDIDDDDMEDDFGDGGSHRNKRSSGSSGGGGIRIGGMSLNSFEDIVSHAKGEYDF